MACPPTLKRGNYIHVRPIYSQISQHVESFRRFVSSRRPFDLIYIKIWEKDPPNIHYTFNILLGKASSWIYFNSNSAKLIPRKRISKPCKRQSLTEQFQANLRMRFRHNQEQSINKFFISELKPMKWRIKLEVFQII